jgi:hypothetical protein
MSDLDVRAKYSKSGMVRSRMSKSGYRIRHLQVAGGEYTIDRDRQLCASPALHVRPETLPLAPG